ncbi:MAG TPA: ATP-binding protein, partial [Polyangia bacterium]|nr:ATP-binding protein [Polyangia bacterium]
MRARLLVKLTLLALGVSLVPLSIVGYSSYRMGETAVRAAVDDSELQIARQVAQHISTEIDHLLGTLRVDSRILDLTRAGDEAPTREGIAKFLQLVYHQSDAFTAVALFDENAQLVGEPAYLDAPEKYDSLKRHEPMHAADVQSLAENAPISDALAVGSAFGRIFLSGPTRAPHVVLAVAFRQTIAGARRVLAAEVTLRDLIAHVENLCDDDNEVKLVDGHARLIGLHRADRHGGALAVQAAPRAGLGQLPESDVVAEYSSGSAGRVIGAFVSAAPFPLGVLVERTLVAALLPVSRIRVATLLWIAVSALVGAFAARVFAGRLAGRVGELADGSRQIAAGNLDVKLKIRSRDELGDLADAFNKMAGSLEGARREILKQQDEIVGWNQTLEKRVDQKTEELRQAQDLLLRARSLTALGGLGSGVAHEINNPLAGILGLAQLLLADLPGIHPARPMVKDIEQQALRIRGIVSNLLRFAQRQAGEGFQPVDLNQIVADAIQLCGPAKLAEAGIHVACRFASTTPPVRGNATALQETFMQLVQNASKAMANGGTLSVEITMPDAALVRVSISDTGRGIAPEDLPRIFDPFFTTKQDWSGVGLGLS